MMDDELALPDGRRAGYTDTGPAGATAVVWCHGGPGSRLEPFGMVGDDHMPFRVVGIDRPGYGRSTPNPGRDIAGWVPEALAVLDHLGVDRFAALGVSTGGAYALALAAVAPERVLGVVACCALTDMRWAEGRALMAAGGAEDIWSAPDREAALAIAADTFGEDGSKLASLATDDGPQLPAKDLAVFLDAERLPRFLVSTPAMFTFGVQGYADDRIADGPGWGTFDVAAIRCPVAVIHGELDTICPVAHAHHTAAIVPGATLELFGDLGHFSIVLEALPALDRLLAG